MSIERISLLTPLDAVHRRNGARMVAFAGYAMPLQYAGGILAEHSHTRTAASLFDVSHMGQIRLRGPGAARMLESLVPADIVNLPEGRQRYTCFTTDAGGILDDLMVSHTADGLLLIVNAARKSVDLERLQAHAAADCSVDPLDDRALIALQGPASAGVVGRLAPALCRLNFMSVAAATLAGIECVVSRSGYTGDDGFEISIPATGVERLTEQLLAEPAVALAGLGARDSLRLEAGLCLYGHDIDESTSPVEAGLAWTIPRARRPGGDRAGGYPGALRIESELRNGPARRLVGLRPAGRAPVREHQTLADAAGRTVGQVTSGGFGATVDGPITMAYVESGSARPGTELIATVRNQPRICRVVALPFVPHRYFRGVST